MMMIFMGYLQLLLESLKARTLNSIIMICQIRGRFSGASGSPLPAPVVTRHGEAW